ncbi:MAG: succinylglutamate desuccinylase/aspartoacylase family protein [Kofleriaceae bacterium]|nr:succinylglutamate desuccinylase/aspartoacylase family protein [Kofleriaceae bacterium]MBP9172770.1 succinylglutamate desuccinylase/aspartoacylase family protein [Kofleriaceae bacterium]MBP9862377.1 succinylglutamate desuccinylase/aspartoacylase family protein [Kofleriaceae bacterium]
MIPPGYRGLAEVAATAAAYGARPIGASRAGRPIDAIEVGPVDAPRALVIAGLHPLEWIGVEVALALAAAWSAGPPPARRIAIVPVANPDGYAAVEDDLRAGRRRWHRTSGPDAHGLGVDLNRNFPIGHQAAPGWSRALPHGGPAPWSEPEARALAAAVGEHPLERAVSLHSFGRMILLPWGHRGERPPRYRELLGHARAIADRLPERYRTWQVGRHRPFRLGGLELDWLTARGALALLVECGGGGLRLTAPATWGAPFHWYNPPDGATAAAPIAAAVAPFLAER